MHHLKSDTYLAQAICCLVHSFAPMAKSSKKQGKPKPKRRVRSASSENPWDPILIATLCREGLRKKVKNDFDTMAKVVNCSDLFHGVHCELNLLGRGNNNFLVPGNRMLKKEGIYMVHVKYDTSGVDSCSTDDDLTWGTYSCDEFTSGTISSVRYLGSASSLAEASTKMKGSVAGCVAQMLSYNKESDECSSS